MKPVKTLITTLTVALIAIVAVQAQDEKPKRPAGGRSGMMDNLLPPTLLEKLNLTADQKAKYEEIVATFKKDTKAFWDSHAELREKLKTAREAGDREKMRELFGEMKPLQELRKAAMEKVEGLLTDDQKKTLKEAMEKFRAGRGAGGPKPEAPKSE